MLKSLDEIIKQAQNEPSKTIAIAAAADDEVLEVVEEATKLGLADFILIGDESKINDIAEKNGRKFDAKIINEVDDKAAAENAVSLVRSGKAKAVMKGLLHTGTFMKAVLNKEKGLNAGKLISQVSIIDNIEGDGLQMITDGVISIAPDLDTKKQIIENAVSLAHKLGNDCPKVALLSAVEVVNPAMQDTLDAAVLSKMNDRGQIKGCKIDGPLAMDNAISVEAAAHKGIESEVAGHADIILVPNIQVGNALIKSITYYAGKDMASAIMGAAAPVIMTSRTDSVKNKLLAMALAALITE